MRSQQSWSRTCVITALASSYALWPERVGAQETYADAIAAAEREGARHPRSAASAATPRRCTLVTRQVEASGDFESRGWANYAAVWYSGAAKLTWWPTHPRVGDTLTVRVISAEHDNDTTAFFVGGPVRSGGSDAYLYPSSVRPARPGAWLFVATAGKNWGCFLYTLPATNPGMVPRPE